MASTVSLPLARSWKKESIPLVELELRVEAGLLITASGPLTTEVMVTTTCRCRFLDTLPICPQHNLRLRFKLLKYVNKWALEKGAFWPVPKLKGNRITLPIYLSGNVSLRGTYVARPWIMLMPFPLSRTLPKMTCFLPNGANLSTVPSSDDPLYFEGLETSVTLFSLNRRPKFEKSTLPLQVTSVPLTRSTAPSQLPRTVKTA